MLLGQKVQAVEEAFQLLHQEMSTFQGWSGLHCKSGCGKCCRKPDIEATVLEFLPLAYSFYKSRTAEEWLQKLQEHSGAYCILFKASDVGSDLCTQYAYRGLICRLFGFSARTNKYAKREFVSCLTIKTEQAENYSATVGLILGGHTVPVMNQYYMRLFAIDPDLGRQFFPINEAIKRAIEIVIHHHAYEG